MPQRATSTSYGGGRGNKRGPGNRTGPDPETFRKRMQYLAEFGAKAKRWEHLLDEENPDDDTFFKAFDRVSDRGYSKPTEKHELSGPDGAPLQVMIVGGKPVSF